MKKVLLVVKSDIYYILLFLTRIFFGGGGLTVVHFLSTRPGVWRHPVRIKSTNNGLLAKLANHYTTESSLIKRIDSNVFMKPDTIIMLQIRLGITLFSKGIKCYYTNKKILFFLKKSQFCCVAYKHTKIGSLNFKSIPNLATFLDKLFSE